MSLTKENKMAHNWFLREKVTAKLEEHDTEGLSNENKVYLGDTHRIEKVVEEFGRSATADDVVSARLYARLSCLNEASKKYHLVSIYQTERDKSGNKYRILEATWTPKGKTPLPDVVEIIEDAFLELIQLNQKYGQKPPEMVGLLHEFQQGMDNPSSRVK
jgi:hypothetical protein